MRNLAAKDAKTRFGELLDTAQREPVAIEKHGRRVAVVLSAQDYDELEAIKRAQLKAALQQGLDELEAGKGVGGEAFFAEMLEEEKGDAK